MMPDFNCKETIPLEHLQIANDTDNVPNLGQAYAAGLNHILRVHRLLLVIPPAAFHSSNGAAWGSSHASFVYTHPSNRVRYAKYTTKSYQSASVARVGAVVTNHRQLPQGSSLLPHQRASLPSPRTTIPDRA